MRGKIRSYYAIVRAASGTLLGGVTEHQSSRFASPIQAMDWRDTVVKTNRDGGRDVKDGVVYPSKLPPEIPNSHV